MNDDSRLNEMRVAIFDSSKGLSPTQESAVDELFDIIEALKAELEEWKAGKANAEEEARHWHKEYKRNNQAITDIKKRLEESPIGVAFGEAKLVENVVKTACQICLVNICSEHFANPFGLEPGQNCRVRIVKEDT